MKNLLLLLFAFALIQNVAAQWNVLNTGISTNLNDVYFINSTTGYAVGDAGVIIKTTNGGISWTTQISHVKARLSSVFFTDVSTGYIVGDSAVFLKTTNGGQNWSMHSLGFPAGIHLNSIYFTNDTCGYIASKSFETNSTSSLILRTTNKWMNWEVDTFGIGAASSIFFPSDSTGYLVGNCIRKTTNAGINWESVSLRNYNFNSVTQNNYQDTVVAVGDHGQIVYGLPGAVIFNESNPGTNSDLNQITYDSQYHKYLIVGDSGSIFMGSDLFNSLNSWNTINSGVTTNLNWVSTFEQSNYSSIIVGDSGTILKTTNTGSSWYTINSGVNTNLNCFAGEHGTNETGYIVGDSGTILKLKNSVVTNMTIGQPTVNLNYITLGATDQFNQPWYIVGDNGTILVVANNFTSYSTQNVGTSIDLSYIHFYLTYSDPTPSGYACGFDHNRNESVILYTTNGGITWHKHYTGFTSRLTRGNGDQSQYQDECLSGEDGTILYASQENYPTSYNFKHWVHFNTLPYAQQLGSVCFTSNRTGFILNRNSKLFRTTDGGQHWNYLPINNLRSVFFTDSLHGYVVGSNGSVKKSDNSGINWSNQTSGTNKDLNKVFFPNENVGFAVGNNGTVIKTWMITVNNPVICPGDTAILTATGNGITYIWSNGATGSSISVAPLATTSYSVTGYSVDGFSDSKVAIVTVTQQANLAVTIDHPIVYPGQSATLCACGCDSYMWNTGQATACIIVVPSVTTTYSVTGTDQCGFMDSATIVVTVDTLTSVYTASDDIPEILLYPVPTNEFLILESSQFLKGELMIHDIRGVELFRQEINGLRARINTSQLANGIYFVKLITDNSIKVRKIIKG